MGDVGDANGYSYLKEYSINNKKRGFRHPASPFVTWLQSYKLIFPLCNRTKQITPYKLELL